MSDRYRCMSISFHLMLALLVLGFTDLAQAQDKDTPSKKSEQAKKTAPRKKPPARRSVSPAQVLVQRFDRAAPQLGDLLPDVSGLDANGKPFPLRSLKGHYTVLTFGCLT